MRGLACVLSLVAACWAGTAPEPQTTAEPPTPRARRMSDPVVATAPPPSARVQPTEPGTDPADGDCAEVSCLLAEHPGACCPPPRKPAQVASQSSSLPESIDRNMITQALSSVRSSVLACGQSSGTTGVVKVHVRVAPDGSVASVSVSQTPDAALGSCVADAVRVAVFAATQHGGTFAYPFRF